MKDTTILFYGFGSEYVLNPLYEEMKEKGFKCIEINALKFKNSKKLINSLINKPVIFITSSHFLLDNVNFRDFYPSENTFYSALEILALIKPKKSIYIPHDLTQPLISMEKYFLNQFDLFISPCDPFTSMYSNYCRTVELGWIKYSSNTIKKKLNFDERAIWFISDTNLHIKMGKEQSYALLSPALKQGIAVKFAARIPYTYEFEEYYKKMGIHVYPMYSNSIELINNHDIIITNGLSSVIAESYWLGKTTVNIMEGSHYGNDKVYLEELFPNLVFIEKILDFKLNKIPIKKTPKILKPFDMNTAIRLITEN